MLVCPYCYKNGIKSIRKLNSGVTNPIQCTYCGELCGLSDKVQDFQIYSIQFGAIFFIAWALYLMRWYPLLFFLLTIIISNVLIFKYAELIRFSKKEVKNAKRQAYIHVLIIIILMVLLLAIFYD